MGKGKRLKAVEKPKEETKPEIKDPKLIMRERSGDAFVKNMKAMEKLGWDKTGFMDELKAAPELPVAIDTNLIFAGIKNPLVSVFIGFSTRKILEALRLQKKVVKYVCIIEPDIRVFKHLIITEDISDLLLNPNMDFLVGVQGELLIPHLFRKFTLPLDKSGVSRTTMIQNLEMILDPFVYGSERKNEGLEYVELIKQTVAQIKLSMGCPDDQFRRLELMMMNKENMLKAWNIKGLFDRFEDVPAFILGGGPSLENFIKEYKENPCMKNGIIIAVDAVLRLLLENGIRPHMVVRCERKRTTVFQGVKKEDTKGIYYCAYPWTPPEYFELFEDSFYLFRQNGVCLFSKIPHGFVDGGVSSGKAALEIAIMLGCKDIVLSGLDMCKIGDKTHIDGTEVEFNIDRSKDKHTNIKTISGKEAITIPVWERCRKEYFQAIQKHLTKGKKLNIINTSFDGAEIPLTTYKPFKDILYLFDNEALDVNGRIENLRAKISVEDGEAFRKIVKEIHAKCLKHAETLEIATELMADAKRTADREIEKQVNACKNTARDSYDLILLLRGQQANLNKLWANVTDSIDTHFKKKLYVDETFRTLVFDILQLQLYHYENSTSGLINILENEDHRHFAYYTITRDFMEQVRHYLQEFIKLFA